VEFQKIIDSLHGLLPRKISNFSGTVQIDSYKMARRNQTDFDGNCIYVGKVSNLPASIDIPHLCSLICIEDISLPQIYLTKENINLYLVDGSIDQSDMLNRIADIMIDDVRVTKIMGRLFDALNANLGLQHMVDVATQCFENPILVNDSAFKILAMSKDIGYGDQTLEETKELGYIHEKNVRLMRKDKIFEQLRRAKKPLLSRKSDDGTGWLMSPIGINNVDVGMVALVENNHPFRCIDSELLAHFSKLVVIELERNDFYKNNKGTMYSYLLADLFENRIQDIVDIERRLSYLDWKIYSFFQVMVIIDNDLSGAEETVQRIGREVRQIIPDCHWTVLNQNLAILLCRPQAQLISERENAILEDFLKQNNLSAGVSQIFYDILESPRYYRQALRGVKLGTYVHRTSGVYEYSKYMLAYIAQVLSKEHSLHEFCHPAIPLIQDYDRKNGTFLLETLEKYLFHVNDLISAASVLMIHRNTLLYRIGKIKEITGLDLSNGDERLQIQMYFKFMDYIKGGWDGLY